jgi:hypothetical protein
VYPAEFRAEAVRLYRASGGERSHEGRQEVGIASELQSEIDAGQREGLSSEERDDLRRLRREKSGAARGESDPAQDDGFRRQAKRSTPSGASLAG